MSITVQELAALVNGDVEGDGGIAIHGAAPLNEAQPGQITFVDKAKYLQTLSRSAASAIVVPRSLDVNGDVPQGKTLIRVDEAMSAFVTILRQIRGNGESAPHGIDPKAIIHPTVTMGKDCDVHAHAILEEGTVLGDRCKIHAGVVTGRNCRMGDDVVLHPNVVLYDHVEISDRVIVHANTVIGADGFGYRFVNGRHEKVPQLGHVEIAEDVEIGPCSTIDRGTFGATRIGPGCKFDDQVMIAHNCRIGAHVVMAAQSAVAGSTTIGNFVVVAGQAGIADHLDVGDGAVIGPQTGVVQDVPAGARHWGCPNVDAGLQKRMMISLRDLPAMRAEHKAMKRRIAS